MLGSDYPFPLGEHHPGKLIESTEDLDEELKEQLLAGNALQFLGLDPATYTTVTEPTSGAN
jgi:aminocarboxymuconate-semialdehyde decarboxylase